MDSDVWKSDDCIAATLSPLPDTAIIAQISYSAMRIIHYVVSAASLKLLVRNPVKSVFRTFFAYRSATVVFRRGGIRRL